MIVCARCQSATGHVERIALAQACLLPAQDGSLLWVDATAPTDEELARLAEAFQLHPLAIEDARKGRQRAKVDPYETHYFIVLKAFRFHAHNSHVDTEELDIFLGANYLITVHQRPLPELEETRRRWEAGKLHHPTAAFLFYLVADSVVDSLFPITDRIGEIVDELDEQLFALPVRGVLRNIFTLRRSLLEIRKALGPMRDVFNELIREDEDGALLPDPAQTRVYFNDVFDHILRITDFIDTYRDMLSSSLDAYQSAQANKLNENMQRLTVAATILATGTVITGFYGMNIKGLGVNNLDNPFGALLILVVLVVITVVEIWLFKRRGWL